MSFLFPGLKPLRASHKLLFIILTVGLPTTAQGRGFDYDWAAVRRLSRDNGIIEAEKFVGKLPEQMRRRYVLQPKTDSLQFASPVDPRLLLFGPGSRLILAGSNKDSVHADRNFLEFAELDGRTGEYLPRAIQFPGAKGSPNDVVYISDPLTYFPPQHRKHCANCHGLDGKRTFKLLWDSYSLWPTALGGSFMKAESSGSSEGKILKNFIKNRAHTGIYQHLSGLDRHPRHFHELNSILTQELSVTNQSYLGHQLFLNPDLLRIRLPLLAALIFSHSEFTAEYRPIEWEQNYIVTYPGLRKIIDEGINDYDRRKLQLYRRTYGEDPSIFGHFDLGEAPRLTNVEYVLKTIGLSMADWSLTKQTGTYNFIGPSDLSLWSLAVDLAENVIQYTDPDLFRLLNISREQNPQTAAEDSYSKKRINLLMGRHADKTMDFKALLRKKIRTNAPPRTRILPSKYRFEDLTLKRCESATLGGQAD